MSAVFFLACHDAKQRNLWCLRLRLRFTIPCYVFPAIDYHRSHLVHIFMTALAAMEGSEAQHLYSTLRAIYNTNLPSFSAPFPPLEEWQGISRCCEYFYCRYVVCIELKVLARNSTRPYDVPGCRSTEGLNFSFSTWLTSVRRVERPLQYFLDLS